MSGFPQAVAGPDTPWTIDHDAHNFDLINLRHIANDMVDSNPSFINAVANLTLAFNPSGRASDTFSQISLQFQAAFGGAAADTVLFEVQLNEGFGQNQPIPFITPATATIVPFQLYSAIGSVGFGFGSFKVLNHVAIPAGTLVSNINYFAWGN